MANPRPAAARHAAAGTQEIAVPQLKIGVVGAGPFANHFIPLYQAHPLVGEVRMAERMPERREAAIARHGLTATYEDFGDLLASDVDAIAVFTQRWTHTPFALAALRAGKHVFSAVPAAVTLEELEELVTTVRETGQLYMLGETSYYHAESVFCRKQLRRGLFGRFVYAEAGYHHDMEHGFYPPYQIANGPAWKQFASFPPMLYPTHSVGHMLGVTGERISKVTCFGQVDAHDDGIFRRDISYFDNDFSNEVALFQTASGAMCRATEFRRVTGGCPLEVYGTRGTYRDQRWHNHDRSSIDLREELTCAPLRKPEDWEEQRRQGAQDDFFAGVAPMHDYERLPASFNGLPNGHGGSHQFLADDFIRMCLRGQHPPLNVWTAARFCAPGIVAHESARRGGECLPVPDFGDPPADLALMDMEVEEGKDPPITVPPTP